VKPLAGSREIHREAFEVGERAMGQCTLMGRTQGHAVRRTTNYFAVVGSAEVPQARRSTQAVSAARVTT
jgi:hypothetical protein